MSGAKRSEQFQLLVNSIEATFKGDHKNILNSLNSLFSIFDDVSLENDFTKTNSEGQDFVETKATALRSSSGFEREMMLGVITMLLNHLIKGENYIFLTKFQCF